jgi:hypothetical protein
MSRADWRRTTDRLRLTRPRDAKPYTWPQALGIGLMWGVIMGIAVGLSAPGRGFSFVPFCIAVALGLGLYGPGIHLGSHRRG